MMSLFSAAVMATGIASSKSWPVDRKPPLSYIYLYRDSSWGEGFFLRPRENFVSFIAPRTIFKERKLLLDNIQSYFRRVTLH